MQTTIPKLGVGAFLTVMLSIVTAMAWNSAMMNVINVLEDLAELLVNRTAATVFEFVALFFWALVATVILVVVAMRQGKRVET